MSLSREDSWVGINQNANEQNFQNDLENEDKKDEESQSIKKERFRLVEEPPPSILDMYRNRNKVVPIADDEYEPVRRIPKPPPPSSHAQILKQLGIFI